MQYRPLYRKAKSIDKLVDEYRRLRGGAFVSAQEITVIISKVFPDVSVQGEGWYKHAFLLCFENNALVLKIGQKTAVENDRRVYKRLPKRLRHDVFAQLFWHTKYCLLQEYGIKTNVSPQELNRFKQIGEKYGLLDVRAENIRQINGKLKLIDANLAPYRISKLAQLAEKIWFRMPKWLEKLVGKASSTLKANYP
ncbi:MAG: hypothetical protein NWF04_07710 [Candidatus Bathyarchaeota archaeon]|nr:hypothetical protein [Candidatus Bathyarchaeota archaeon]